MPGLKRVETLFGVITALRSSHDGSQTLADIEVERKESDGTSEVIKNQNTNMLRIPAVPEEVTPRPYNRDSCRMFDVPSTLRPSRSLRRLLVHSTQQTRVGNVVRDTKKGTRITCLAPRVCSCACRGGGGVVGVRGVVHRSGADL